MRLRVTQITQSTVTVGQLHGLVSLASSASGASAMVTAASTMSSPRSRAPGSAGSTGVPWSESSSPSMPRTMAREPGSTASSTHTSPSLAASCAWRRYAVVGASGLASVRGPHDASDKTRMPGWRVQRSPYCARLSRRTTYDMSCNEAMPRPKLASARSSISRRAGFAHAMSSASAAPPYGACNATKARTMRASSGKRVRARLVSSAPLECAMITSFLPPEPRCTLENASRSRAEFASLVASVVESTPK
mmetsp:Transcript_10754/g.27918  ORF Transcript_10754/g.27918 Transcript_10754/m.27918 type:complete len:249 (-) Transcript_10754:94-840(-)